MKAFTRNSLMQSMFKTIGLLLQAENEFAKELREAYRPEEDRLAKGELLRAVRRYRKGLQKLTDDITAESER